MGDAGEIASAVTSVANLVTGILDRSDRDEPDKELNENIVNIQNSFANNNLDEQYINMYKLFTYVGYPPTPGGSVGDNERQFRHSALLIAAQLLYERKLAARAIAKLTAK